MEWDNEVTDRFRNFVYTARTQAKVTTRELGKAVEKSAAFISLLERGNIKTIEFNVAYELLNYINNKRPVISEEEDASNTIFNLLTDVFSIYPKKYWEDMEREAEAYEKSLEDTAQRVNEKMQKVSAIMEPHDEELAEIFFKVAKADLNRDQREIIKDIIYIMGNEKEEEKAEALYMIMDIFRPVEFGNKYMTKTIDIEKKLVLKKFFVRNKIIKEEQ